MLRLSSMLLVIVSLELTTVVLFDDRNIFNKRQQWGLDEHYLFSSIRDELDTLHVADGLAFPKNLDLIWPKEGRTSKGPPRSHKQILPTSQFDFEQWWESM